MMRNKFILLAIFCIYVGTALSQKLEKKLSQLSEEYNFTYESMTVDSMFSEKYILWFEQPIDHIENSDATFKQRVFLSHIDFESPVVFITEGYAANYAAKPGYRSELAALFNTNQVCVEHRYFGSSKPTPTEWEYLTVANAAADQHRIIEVLKNIYEDKWISTGISKGGQTTMYHRYFYPDDVDISVAYVAPLNFSIEDQRVYTFLDNVGTEKCRDRILAFQKELMRNKKKYISAFEKLATAKGLTYSMGIDKAYDLIVFEYSFAFWQWGRYECDEIPENLNNPEKAIDHLHAVTGIEWVANEGVINLQPFFYQAMREIGFYGYDISPFREWTSYKENPIFEFTLPEGVTVEYEPELMQKVDYFVRHEAENMLFIYGEYDPWSSTAVDLTYHTNSVKIVKPGGSHTTRINNLPPVQKAVVIKILEEWLGD